MDPDPANPTFTMAELQAAIASATAIESRRLEALFNEQLLAIEARMKAEVKPKSKPTVKPPAPSRYGGKVGEAESWLDSVELFLSACGIEDPDCVPYAATLLESHAGTWWRTVRNDATPITTWAHFKEELLHNFKHQDPVKAARTKLHYLRQRTSVSTYFSEFNRLVLQIPGISEDEQVDRFFRGLKPNLQKEITLREPKGFRSMVKMAHQLDTLYYSADRPKSFSHAPASTPMELGAVLRPSSRGPFPSSRPSTSQASGSRPSFKPAGPPRPSNQGGSWPPYRRPLTDADRERLLSEKRCFYCKEKGHYAEYCPLKPGNEKRAGKAHVR